MLIILPPLSDIPEFPWLLMVGITALSLRVTLKDLALRIGVLLTDTPLAAGGVVETLLLKLLLSEPLPTVGRIKLLLGTDCIRGARMIARSLIIVPLPGMAPLVRIILVLAMLFPLLLSIGSRRMIL